MCKCFEKNANTLKKKKVITDDLNLFSDDSNDSDEK